MISIIGLLASLIAPAAMRARESARRMQCLSNLREMMRATTAHQTATTKFPIGKAVKTERGIENTSIHIQLLDFLDQSVVARALKPDAELHAFDSPPTSEANAQYLTHSIPVFICPSDSVPPGGNSYRGCYGTTPGYHYTQMTSPEGALPGAFSSFGGRLPQDIRDGLSHTVFFSEKLVGDQQSTRYDSLRDSFVCGGNLLLPSDALKVCRLPAGVEPEHAS